jgi:hypothetical protein
MQLNQADNKIRQKKEKKDPLKGYGSLKMVINDINDSK